MLTQAVWKKAVFFLTAFLVLAADLSTKTWVRTYDEGQTIFQAGFFRLINVQNTGAAFGIFRGQSLLFTIIAIIIVVVILLFIFLFYRRVPFLDNKLSMLALGLLFSGAAGNLIDRLCRGYVTDFIDVGIWPAFNVADSATTVGSAILIFIILFRSGVLRASE